MRDPVVFFFRYPTAMGTPGVRRVYDGTPPTRRRIPSSFSPKVGSSSWSCTLRPLLPLPGPEAFAYLVCLGAHKVSTRPPRGRCSLSWTATGSKSSGRPVACEGATQLNEGSNPKTGRVRGPINEKDLAKRQIWRWIGNEESPHCTGVTPQRPSTPAQPPPHCNSTALRVVTGVGQGFLWLVSFRLWVRWVGLWHSRWKSLPRDPSGWSQRLRDSRDRVSKSSVVLACPVWQDE